jgi:hypothetical protein
MRILQLMESLLPKVPMASSQIDSLQFLRLRLMFFYLR